jgi:hypothetical protein
MSDNHTAETVSITLDNRIRLMAAALAATNFPETSQQRRRYHAHAYARATTKYMSDNGYKNHPAIQTLQTLLNQNAPLEALFTLIMLCRFPTFEIEHPPRWMPAGFNEQLRDFYETCKMGEYWANNAIPWENAEAQAKKVFAKVHFRTFLRPFLEEVHEDFLFMPNICYPADDEIGIRVGNQLIAIVPPPQAWGDSPPWGYDEESMLNHSYRAALTQYGRLLMTAYLRANAEKVAEATKKELAVTDQFKARHPEWEDQFISLFTAAAVAMYLEDHVSSAEARSYLLMEKKARGMTFLPGTVSVLRRYLQERGNKYETLADFLSVFPAQLRVAKKIVTI